MALLEFFGLQTPALFQKNVSFSFYQFAAGRYGNVPTKQAFTPGMESTIGSLPVIICQFSIEPDIERNGIPLPHPFSLEPEEKVITQEAKEIDQDLGA